MTTLSTHVLDAVTGTAAVGVSLTLTGPGGEVLTRAGTDADGRARLDADLGAGVHRLTFATGEWFAAAGRETFHPEVVVAFTVTPGADARPHLHVPLLLSPFAYSTYRGS
ncbi:hydroxyisourate hydrolase [Kineococcus radiotolerans]|uniref:5-hydroxyisourate hydrolase n=1 Tax=Kineococcus radiotolerans (strain ATCC BAA-149 / DSM 14245 / SRS30216) TaxID=266940 RepID=A6W9R6_KINRD|nr:hydroxyisourate hydrolase [Kineococcus radiotolerans]ABS03555.1 Transthyretin [Kineococcus radiotolerans SRS30216 = ATCC BAA-149]